MTEPESDTPADAIDFSIARLYAGTRRQQTPVRVAVAVDGRAGTRVAERTIQDLRNAGFVALSCFILPAQSARSSAHSPAAGASDLLRRLYETKIDVRHRTPCEPDDIVDLSGSVAGIALLEFDASPVALQRIRDAQLDVIVWLGTAAPPAPLAACAKHGLWKFHYGDSSRYRSPTPYLWELLESEPTCGVELHALTGAAADPYILCKSQFAATAYPSVTLNERGPRWGSQHFMIQKLWELHELGWEHLVSRRALPQPKPAGTRTRTAAPSNAQMLPWLARQAAKKAAIRLRREPRIDHWRIAIRRSSTPLYEEKSLPQALRQFQWHDSPLGRFWADPFLLAHRGELWLLLEEFDYESQRAHLSACRLDARGGLGPVEPILQRPYHLSYPHVFAHGGEIYMIPESAESGAVELYRARTFPNDWVLECRLLEMRCVDTTVVFRSDRWWMFTSPMTVPGHAPITLLFSSPQLQGPWTHHADSPLSRDVRYARGAGAIIEDGSRLLRPSQDCARGYGHSLVFNEIVRLDAAAYQERPGLKILPGWMPEQIGVHTYNRVGDIEVIDGKFVVPRSRVRD